MSSIRVKLNLAGISEALKSPEVSSALEKRAKAIAEAAGEGFEAVVKPGRYTARAFVQTADAHGRARQARDGVLERSMGAGS